MRTLSLGILATALLIGGCALKPVNQVVQCPGPDAEDYADCDAIARAICPYGFDASDYQAKPSTSKDRGGQQFDKSMRVRC